MVNAQSDVIFLPHCGIFRAGVVFFVVGKFMYNPDEALYSVNFICLFGLWIYTINVLKNLKIILILLLLKMLHQ